MVRSCVARASCSGIGCQCDCYSNSLESRPNLSVGHALDSRARASFLARGGAQPSCRCPRGSSLNSQNVSDWPQRANGSHRAARRPAAQAIAGSQMNQLTSTPGAIEPAHPAPPVLRIAPPGRWWAIPFAELWESRELIYFFVWREIKVRYKQTAIGAAWAVLQPFMSMLVFTLFFGRLAHIPSRAAHTRSSITARFFLGCTSPTACKTPPAPSCRPVHDHQSLFPASGPAVVRGSFGTRRFRHRLPDVPGHDDLLRHPAGHSDFCSSRFFFCLPC